jgi:hypothetical protein
VVSDLETLERRLQAILDPYRERLETFEVYGQTMLRLPGRKSHQWFAGVRTAGDTVKFSLLPMHAHPELLDPISPALRKRKTGASLFTLRPDDGSFVHELEALVARAFDVYAEGS